MLEQLREAVFRANMELPARGLIIYTWGNVSGIDRKTGYVVIKPSGVPYENMKAADMVIVDLQGNIVEGKLNPSSDLATHLELYKYYGDIGSIVHTHSRWATIWAQAAMCIPALGTTHADYFSGDIPCTRSLTSSEVFGNYEKETGKVIIETVDSKKVMDIPAVLVSNHGPFIWGKDTCEAVYNAVVLEEVAERAYYSLQLNKEARMSAFLLKKHYERKHGEKAYYGQD